MLGPSVGLGITLGPMVAIGAGVGATVYTIYWLGEQDGLWDRIATGTVSTAGWVKQLFLRNVHRVATAVEVATDTENEKGETK